MQDLIELKLCPNPSYKPDAVVDDASFWSTSTILAGAFYCPITLVEMNGTHAFSVISTCGCVMSDKALKEVKTETCLRCGAPFKAEDIVKLNPSDEEVAKLREEVMAKIKTKKSKEASEDGLDGKKDKLHAIMDDESGPALKKQKVEVTTLSKASSVAREADRAIKEAKSSNPLLASLFHTPGDKSNAPTANDLLMRVATHRYMT